ncbi:MAG: helix-turn-helix transcriptional regulator [Microbacterium sp.]
MPHNAGGELGDFLRARRTDASLAPPQQHGAGRRRISGLRREEVAAAAGISVDYYIRLEQGRESHPSDAVLDALARVLHLTPDARDHLDRLRKRSSAPMGGARDRDETLATRLAALVDAVRPHPAYVLDRLSNMVAANPEGLALYDGFAQLAAEERNTCRYLFTDPRAPRIFLEWEELARGAVMHLRATNAGDLRSPELHALVADLSRQSPRFAELWSEHIVEHRRTSITHIRANTGDIIARRYEVLHLPDEALRMTLWLPEPEATSAPRVPAGRVEE